MGQECAAVCHWAGQSSSGTAMLEGDHLLFRGGFRLKIPFADLKAVTACNGRLSLMTADGTAALDLGAKAADWAERIRNPRSLADKLGLAAGTAVDLVGDAPDPALLEELAAKGIVATRRADPEPGAAWIILSVSAPPALDRVPACAAALGEKGALWIVHPKGARSPVPQDLVFAAGRGAGLADVKTCAVSATSTGLKFVRRKG